VLFLLFACSVQARAFTCPQYSKTLDTPVDGYSFRLYIDGAGRETDRATHTQDITMQTIEVASARRAFFKADSEHRAALARHDRFNCAMTQEALNVARAASQAAYVDYLYAKATAGGAA